MKNLLIYNPFSYAVKNVGSVLDPDQKKKAWIMVFLMVVNAFFDFAGLATIGALIISALEDNIFAGAEYARTVGESDLKFYFNSKLRDLYDFSGADNHISFLFYLSIFIFLAFIIKNAISLYIGYIQTRFAYNVSFRLNKKMFKYFYDQGYLFIKESTSGKRVYSIVDIPMRFASHILSTLLLFGTELFVMIIIAIALLFISPIAVVMLGLTILPTFYIIYRFSKNKVREIGFRRNELSPKNYGKILEAMNGFVDVKLSNIENEMLEKYSSTQKKLNHVDAIFFGIYHKLNQRTNDIIFGLGILVIFGYAHFLKLGTSEVLSLLGLFAIAAYKFIPSVNRMMTALMTLKNSAFVFHELKNITNYNLEKFKVAEPLDFDHSLKIRNISYVYPNTENVVLDKFDLEINKGETIGIIGSSGSGKTTILKILLRLLKEQEGQLEVDNQIITDEIELSYQRIIGYVEQEIFILNDTLRNNVAFGIDNPDEEKVWNSIKEAKLYDYVKSHPDGLDMILGENGVNLSGGQKQRVGIARALFKDSKILLFDEATSALDVETEQAVVESINHLSKLGKTIVIVAHRLTTLEKCDRIIELKNGKFERDVGYKELIEEKIKTH